MPVDRKNRQLFKHSDGWMLRSHNRRAVAIRIKDTDNYYVELARVLNKEEREMFKALTPQELVDDPRMIVRGTLLVTHFSLSQEGIIELNTLTSMILEDHDTGVKIEKS